MGLTGLLLAEFCESWSLAPVNTYYDIGGTCSPGPNRIDFVGGTNCRLSQTVSCEVWHHSGDQDYDALMLGIKLKQTK